MNLRSRDRVVTNVQLARRLCDESPDLCDAHARHVAEHGNLIPHVFMGTVLARAKACSQWAGTHADPRHAELVGILATLEHGMEGGDRETVAVIGISFVREAEGELFFGALRPLLGPRLGALTDSR